MHSRYAKCILVGKMHWQNAHVGKMHSRWQNAFSLVNCNLVGKMHSRWQNAFSLGKMHSRWQNAF